MKHLFIDVKLDDREFKFGQESIIKLDGIEYPSSQMNKAIEHFVKSGYYVELCCFADDKDQIMWGCIIDTQSDSELKYVGSDQWDNFCFAASDLHRTLIDMTEKRLNG